MKRRKKSHSKDLRRDPSLGVKYARVSSKEQEKEGYSIPAQIKMLDDHASKEGVFCADEFIDVETAKNSGRTSFEDMVRFLKKNRRVGTILVEKTDRLYRNLRDVLTINELGVEIHFVKEGAIISENSTSAAKFMHGVRVLMAKQYIDNLSEEVIKGMTEKANQGYWPSVAPYGYLNTKNAEGRNIIIVDPDHGPIVREIYNLYLYKDMTLEDVVNELSRRGIRKKNRKFYKSAIEFVLKNRTYSGEFIWKGKLYNGLHEPIVTREEWRLTQEKMAGRSNNKSSHAPAFAFSSLMKCKICGSSVVAELKKSKYTYYHLSAHMNQCKREPKECKKTWVKEEDLDRYFGGLLKELEFDEEVLSWLQDALSASESQQRRERENAIARLEGEERRLADRIEKLYVDKLDGSVEPEFFTEISAKWRQERDRCRREIEVLSAEEASYIEQGRRLLEFVRNAHQVFERQPPLEKRRLLNFVLSNCEWEDGTPSATLRQPFDSLRNRQKKTESANWLGRQDSNLGMSVPKTDALPLGDAPMVCSRVDLTAAL
jgi:site-specific DNA recombinase